VQPARAQQTSAPACDRECLRSKITEVLHALVEDGVEKPLAQVALVRSVTRLRGYRQDVGRIDIQDSQCR
jgi:hypothetical protein